MRVASIAIFLMNYNWILSWARGGPHVTELYETCTGEQGYQARCGPGANCFIMGGVPTCHCIVDLTTGLPLAGNPYRACTWDLTGKWEAYFSGSEGVFRRFSNPFTNEPYVIQIDRTDAILKTQYITGAIFIVTAITGSAAGICARAYVDVNDNSSVILELAEGFVDASGRSMYFRNRRNDVSLWKKWPKSMTRYDPTNLWGGWKTYDGNKVKICEFHRKNYGSFYRNTGHSTVITPTWAYWYNDESFGAPAIRLSLALWLDDTLPFERQTFETGNRFLQLGWFGQLAMGAGTITILAPGDGKEIFTLRRLYDYELPTLGGMPSTSFTLTGVDQIAAIQKSVTSALPSSRRLQVNDSSVPVLGFPRLYTKPRPREPSDDFGVFTSLDRLREMGAMNITQTRKLQKSEEGIEKADYPDPQMLQLQSSCPRQMMASPILPKVTIDDLKKFKDLGKAPNQGSREPEKGTQGFLQLDSFFGQELDETDESTYDLLWSRMAVRLSQAQKQAEDRVKQKLGRY